jgi:HlyD family secretion protein
MNRRNVVVAAVITLFFAVFILVRCGKSSASAFQTATVTRGPITQAVTATGTLNPVVNVQVGSQVSGNIQKLFADFNSPVKAGQTVAQIDPALFQATVTQAEGDLASAQAGLELARINATRTQALVAKQNSAQSELDQAMANLHQAEANVKIKQGALDKAKADLEHCTIIFTIANDLTKMQIDTNVAEADVGVVVVNQQVDFTVDAFPNQTFHGQVVQVRNAPITVQNVVTYDTVIGVSNPELKLKPGMTANVSIVISHKDDVLKISNAALRYRPADAATPEPQSSAPAQGIGGAGRPGGGPARDRHTGRTVYALQGNRPQPVQIKTGISDGVMTEVADGLKEGERVVTAQLSGPTTANATQPGNPFSGPRRF